MQVTFKYNLIPFSPFLLLLTTLFLSVYAACKSTDYIILAKPSQFLCKIMGAAGKHLTRSSDLRNKSPKIKSMPLIKGWFVHRLVSNFPRIDLINPNISGKPQTRHKCITQKEDICGYNVCGLIYANLYKQAIPHHM